MLRFTAAPANDDVNPANFTTEIDNPFLPLQPGTTFIYKGLKEGSKLRDWFAVTDNTIVVDGVTCRVVHDRVFVKGVLQEDTFDYFAQDIDGNVWYFGEDTKELDILVRCRWTIRCHDLSLLDQDHRNRTRWIRVALFAEH